MHFITLPRPRLLSASALLVVAASAVLAVASPAHAQAIPGAAAGARVTPPAVKREFRGAWVAAVSNINWPSRPGLSTAAQQAELRTILDRAVSVGLNAVILHVRPAADALYASPYEPWSEYLTGQQGLAPDPYYDPLEFAVKEAHARGLELHAWFNPYRARHPSARSAPSARHVSVAKPHWVRSYGRHLWMDPGEPEVRKHTIRVMADVARRYAVDGVHIDDYFYPYRERDSAGTLLDFPDSTTYARYRAGGGTLARDDWRRDNVNRMVRELYAEIKRVRPSARVGVSPFGIWRPGTPEGVQGFDPFTQIYADSRTWWHEGWLDYFVPQLYYLTDSPQPYPALVRWWAGENRRDRHLYIGIATVNVGTSRNPKWAPAEIRDQLRVAAAQPGVTGHVHWSEKGLHTARELASEALLSGRTMLDSLCACSQPAAQRDTVAWLAARRDSTVQEVRAAYAEPALVPESPWLGRGAVPGIPVLRVRRDSLTGGAYVHVTGGTPATAWLWVVQLRDRGTWRTRIVAAGERRIALTHSRDEPLPEVVAVSAVNRMSAQGRAAVWRRP